MKRVMSFFYKLKGFTLVETLIMVAVVGVIAIIAMASLRNMRPDKDYMMIRKAYSEIAKVVADLANDDELYPVAKTQMAYKPENTGKYLASMMQRVFAIGGCVTGYTCPKGGVCVSDGTCYSSYLRLVACQGPLYVESGSSCVCSQTAASCDRSYQYFDQERCGCFAFDPSSNQTGGSSSSSSNTTSNTTSDPCTGPCGCSATTTYFTTTQKNACKAAGGSVINSCGECHCEDMCYIASHSNNCAALIETLNSNTYSSLTQSFKNSLLSQAGCSGTMNTNDNVSDNGLGNGGSDPCLDNPASCINSPIVPDTTSTDFSGNTAPQGGSAGEGDFTLPSFNPGSRGNVFTNTNVPSGAAFTSSNKFAYSFSHSFETKATPSCSGNICTFSTKDGMSWEVTDNFNSGSRYAIIAVDINGSNPPNSRESGNIDQFRFKVDPSGAISLFDPSTSGSYKKAMKAISSRKFRKED